MASKEGQTVPMRNMISLMIGAVALLMVAIAFIPFLGWANWLIIPLAIIGLGIGATSGQTSGRTLNLIVILIGVGRLMLGGGLL